MEVASLKHRPALRGPTPFLRLQGDERLVTLTRRGNQSAYEVLVARYQTRLLAFCRHMVSSKEDAEDVLQEVFAAAFNAMVADDRPINVRPWLYRIARNRSLNHLRKQTAIGVDSMDVHLADHGTTTADRVHEREEFRQLVGDVQELPETQRTALLLREIDALSYEQISQAMETTVPAIKSLLVRARVGLAEAAEARALSCEEVRLELGEVAEGLRRKSPPVRRHVRGCDRCAGFDKRLAQTNRTLAAVFPVGPLLLVKKFLLAQGAGSAAGAASAAGGSAAAGAGVTGGALSAGISALATKTVAVVAGAAIVTAGAVEVDSSRRGREARSPVAAVSPVADPAVASAAPRIVATTPQPLAERATELVPATVAVPDPARAPASAETPEAAAPADPVVAPVPAPAVLPADPAAAPPVGVIDTGSGVTSLPPAVEEQRGTAGLPAEQPRPVVVPAPAPDVLVVIVPPTPPTIAAPPPADPAAAAAASEAAPAEPVAPAAPAEEPAAPAGDPAASGASASPPAA